MSHLVKYATVLLFIFTLSQHVIAQETPNDPPRSPLPVPRIASMDKKIMVIIQNYLGVRYRRGGSSKSGVDCSGFVRLVYRKVYGIDLPYVAATQQSMPIFREITLKDLGTGDLIFFSPTTRKKRINHVGIYLEDGRFAHAIERKGVIVSSLKNRHWRSRIFSAKRIESMQSGGFKAALHTGGLSPVPSPKNESSRD